MENLLDDIAFNDEVHNLLDGIYLDDEEENLIDPHLGMRLDIDDMSYEVNICIFKVYFFYQFRCTCEKYRTVKFESYTKS